MLREFLGICTCRVDQIPTAWLPNVLCGGDGRVATESGVLPILNQLLQSDPFRVPFHDPWEAL